MPGYDSDLISTLNLMIFMSIWFFYFYHLICFRYNSVLKLFFNDFVCVDVFSYLVDGQMEREPLVEVVRPSQIDEEDVP